MELGAGRCAEGEHLGGVEEGLAAGSRSLHVVPVQTSDVWEAPFRPHA